MPTATRRGVLVAGGATAATAGLAALSGPSGPLATPAQAAVSPASLVAPEAALHMLRRATYGPTPESVAEIRAIGIPAWLERQLNPATIDDAECDRYLTAYPRLGMSIGQLRAGAVQRFAWDVQFETGQASLLRAAWSKRQLLEVMVDFWSNHLNVSCPFDAGWDNRHSYDRDVIRPHALGRFSSMLMASAFHPSMLYYLDNASSTKRAPNENYARELMELHTVGVDGGYSERQVKAAARLLTGITVDGGSGLFRYRPENHATGAVSILGFRHRNATPAGGLGAVRAFLLHLAMHPATARRIATKLCLRFVSDTPSPALVSALAATYLANGTAIAPVLRQLFGSAEFKASLGLKVRRPLEDHIATIRILGIKPKGTIKDGISGLYWRVQSIGHAPMAWKPPNGYPDVSPAWQSAATALGRWNNHIALVAGWWPDRDELAYLDDLRPRLVGPRPSTHGALLNLLSSRMYLPRFSPAHRAAILSFLKASETTPLTDTSSAWTWELHRLITLMLGSPYHAAR